MKSEIGPFYGLPATKLHFPSCIFQTVMFSVDDLVSSLETNHIGQDQINLAELQVSKIAVMPASTLTSNSGATIPNISCLSWPI
jgi:hypothetical protein